jgi:GGDEF domain-containing protein
MDKRFSWIFLAASTAFFVFIVGLTGYRIETVRRANTLLARDRIAGIAGRAAGLRDAAGGFDSPLFRQEMRRLFDAETRLLLVAIHSPSQGTLYLVSRNKSYIREPAGAADHSAAPAYQYSRGYEVLASRPLPAGSSGAAPMEATVDGLFVIMGREDLYPILRDDLYLFLAFLLVCGVFILIVTGIQQDEPPARRQPEAGPRSAGGERSLMSPSTGLVWAEYLGPRLRAEIDRAAAGDQDISFASVRLDSSSRGEAPAAARAAVARVLQECFSSHDLIFETGSDSFAIVLPDTDVDQAVRSLETLRSRASQTQAEGRPCPVSIGASSRAGRLVEEKTLQEEARIALEKAAREGGNRVVGFRADPARFRRTLAG